MERFQKKKLSRVLDAMSVYSVRKILTELSSFAATKSNQFLLLLGVHPCIKMHGCGSNTFYSNVVKKNPEGQKPNLLLYTFVL